MGEFDQTELITTLRKSKKPIKELEDELYEYSRDKKLALLLPALYSEFEGPALPHIINELKEVPYINEIVMPLGGKAYESQFRQAKDAMSVLKNKKRDVNVIWIESPRILKIAEKIEDEVGPTGEHKKGYGAWVSEGAIIGREKSDIIALHDCDIVNYDRSLLANLVHPAMHPDMNYAFVKGFYARIGEVSSEDESTTEEKFYGRMTRLFGKPIMTTLKNVAREYSPVGDKVYEFLKFANEFKFIFAGEFVIETEDAKKQRITDNYGLETVQLWEAFHKISMKKICQKEIADTYEHRHQELKSDDSSQVSGLQKMAQEISLNLYDRLIEGGMELNVSRLNVIEKLYYNLGKQFINKYRDDAMSRGILYNSAEEEKTLELFYNTLRGVKGMIFNERGEYTPPDNLVIMPNWERIHAAIPTVYKELISAIRQDNKI